MTRPSAGRRAGRAGRRLAILVAAAFLASAVPPAGPVFAAAAPASAPAIPSTSAPATLPSPAASQNATFGIQPVTNGRTDSRTAFTYQTGPGGAYQDSFAVVNYGARPLLLQVYAADLTNNADGGLSVGSATDKSTGAATWLRLPTGLTSVRTPAATAKTGPGLVRVPFAWAVPTSAAAGDHTAAIVVSLSVQSKGKNGQPVRLDQRVAARVFFRVSGAIRAQLSVTDVDVDYSGTWNPIGSGEARVSYTLKNTGNVRLGAKQTLASSAWFGSGGSPDPIAEQPLLLPGGSVRVTAAVRHVFPGLQLTEKLHVVPVRAADDVNVSAKAFDVDASTWAVPWALIAAIAVLIALIVLLVLRIRKRRRSRPVPRHGRSGASRPGGAGPDGGPQPDGESGANALAGQSGDTR